MRARVLAVVIAGGAGSRMGALTKSRAKPVLPVFLGHISTHFVPGRNLSWFVVFLVALGAYLAVLARLPANQST